MNNMCHKKRIRGANFTGPQSTIHRKRSKLLSASSELNYSRQHDFLDTLLDDIILAILAKLASITGCPADFISVLSTCKRLTGLGLHSLVSSKASSNCLAVKPKNWSESSHRCLKRCFNVGNAEASYTFGMIRFYCLQKQESRASFMAKAAICSHALALYSLAVIQFKSSGGMKNGKDLRARITAHAPAKHLTGNSITG